MRFTFPYYMVKPGSNILLYGAGLCGKEFYLQAHISSYCNIVAWVDKNFDVQELDKPFDCLENIKNYAYDFLIIAIADYHTAMMVKQELISLGIDEAKIVWSAQYPLSIDFLPQNEAFYLKKFPDYVNLLDTYLQSGIVYGGEKYYQSFNSLGLGGSRPSGERIILYELTKYLTDKSTVLDIGCNVGFLDLQVAPLVKKIIGIDVVDGVIQVARNAAKLAGITNAEFVCKNVFTDGIDHKYDAIFMFAVHGVIAEDSDFLNVINSINKDGYLFFESHDTKEDLERYDRRCRLLIESGMKLLQKKHEIDAGAKRIIGVFQKGERL